jgi:hypothetical protein
VICFPYGYFVDLSCMQDHDRDKLHKLVEVTVCHLYN